jgi:hypothetical protein
MVFGWVDLQKEKSLYKWLDINIRRIRPITFNPRHFCQGCIHSSAFAMTGSRKEAGRPYGCPALEESLMTEASDAYSMPSCLR